MTKMVTTTSLLDRFNIFSATTFPKLRICSHSQHSLAKVQKLYPDLDPEIMQKLYGFASSREEKDLWNKLVITKDHILISWRHSC